MNTNYTRKSRTCRGKGKKVSKTRKNRVPEAFQAIYGEVQALRDGDQVMVQLPLNVADSLNAAEAELEEIALSLGVILPCEFMEAEVDKLVGLRYKHLKGRSSLRWGKENGLSGRGWTESGHIAASDSFTQRRRRRT